MDDRRTTAPTAAYLAAVTVLTVTAAGLVHHHVRLVGGSYISLVTALLVVS